MAPRANIRQPLHRGDWTVGIVVLFTAADLQSWITWENLSAAPPPFQPCSKQTEDKSGPRFTILEGRNRVWSIFYYAYKSYYWFICPRDADLCVTEASYPKLVPDTWPSGSSDQQRQQLRSASGALARVFLIRSPHKWYCSLSALLQFFSNLPLRSNVVPSLPKPLRLNDS